MKKIFFILGFIFLLLAIVSLYIYGNPWLPIMFLLGGVFGPVMFISYPFALVTKMIVSSGFIFTLITMVYGFRHHQSIKGQILAVVGVMIWILLGIIYGLGTGT